MPRRSEAATDDMGKDGRLLRVQDRRSDRVILWRDAVHSAGLDRERQTPEGLDLVQAAMAGCEGWAGTNADG